MSELSKLPNVGKVCERSLVPVGIKTPKALRAADAREAFPHIRRVREPEACPHMRYGIQPPFSTFSTRLPEETRREWEAFFPTLQAQTATPFF